MSWFHHIIKQETKSFFLSAIFVKTYRQMSTSWSSSVQLHSYKSLQLTWLWFIRSPSSWTALAGASSQTFLKARTLAASLYTCFARWYSLKVDTKRKNHKWVNYKHSLLKRDLMHHISRNIILQITYKTTCLYSSVIVSITRKPTNNMRWSSSSQGFILRVSHFCCIRCLDLYKSVIINT